MARKRPHPTVNVSSVEYDDVSLEDVQCSQLSSVNEFDSYHTISVNDPNGYSSDVSLFATLFFIILEFSDVYVLLYLVLYVDIITNTVF